MKTQTATEEKGLTELQIKALAHYDRMIAWVKTRPENESPNDEDMIAGIDENWYGEDCPFCRTYFNDETDEAHPRSLCPLSYRYQCCGGLWVKMDNAETWGEWIAAAEKVKEYIIEHGGGEK